MKTNILKLRAEGKTYTQITKELGCAKSTVSYYCGKDQKDKFRIRNNKNKTDFCKCGSKKAKISLQCSECDINFKASKILNKSKLDFDAEYKKGKRYYTIRKYARLTMLKSLQEKKCKVCNFDLYVEVCHIKPIALFNEDEKLSDINNIKNLVYLCPNHHIMLDKGLLTL